MAFEEIREANGFPRNFKNYVRVIFGRSPVWTDEQRFARETRLSGFIHRLKTLGEGTPQQGLIQELYEHHERGTLSAALTGKSFRAFFRDWRKLGPEKAQELFTAYNRLSASDHFVQALQEQVLSSLAEKAHSQNPRLQEALSDLAHSKITTARIGKMISGGKFWLKIPLSIALGVFTYGVVISGFDVKYMQPYQREVVRLRGDTKEFLKPAFLGAIPGVMTYAALYFTPFIQRRLGHFWSFAVAGLAGHVVWGLSTYHMFNQILKTPRKNKPKVQSKPYSPQYQGPLPLPNTPMAQKPTNNMPINPWRVAPPLKMPTTSNAFTMTNPHPGRVGRPSSPFVTSRFPKQGTAFQPIQASSHPPSGALQA